MDKKDLKEPDWQNAEASLLSAFDTAITQNAPAPSMSEELPFGDEEDHDDEVFDSVNPDEVAVDVRGNQERRVSELRVAKEFEQEETTMVVELPDAEEYSKPMEASPSLIRERESVSKAIAEVEARKKKTSPKAKPKKSRRAPPVPTTSGGFEKPKDTAGWLNAASDSSLNAFKPVTPSGPKITRPKKASADVKEASVSVGVFSEKTPTPKVLQAMAIEATQVSTLTTAPAPTQTKVPVETKASVKTVKPKAAVQTKAKAAQPKAAVKTKAPATSASENQASESTVSLKKDHVPKPTLQEIPDERHVDTLGTGGSDDTFSRPRIKRDFDIPRANTRTDLEIPLELRRPTRPVYTASGNNELAQNITGNFRSLSTAHQGFGQAEMSAPVIPSWSERAPLTGAIDRALTQEAWKSERLPFGQEHVVPVVENEDVFDIEREIAKGKSGTVYVARIPEADEAIALKVLSKNLSVHLQARQRFRREIRSHAALSHPNIVRVFRYGRRRGRYFMATELMLGSLQELVKQSGPLPTAICAIVLEDILKGIQYAHLRQVLHRELKPSNILVSPQGDFKIGDFSVAKSFLDPNQSQANALFGTPGYMSPEQAAGRKLGPRSDLFAIASLGYFMLLGQDPYERKGVHDTLEAVKAAAIAPPDCITPAAHPVLSRIIAKLGRTDPQDRYESAYEALKDLWPLSRLVQKRYPKVRKQFAKNPERIAKQLRDDESKLELEHAKRVLSLGNAHAGRSALATYRAYALAPHSTDAVQALRNLEQKYGFEFDRKVAKRMGDLLRAPKNLDPYSYDEQSNKARDEGRIWDAYRALTRFVVEKPGDEFANARHEALAHRSVASPFDRGKFSEDIQSTPEVGSLDRVHGTGSTVSFKLPTRQSAMP